MCSMFFGLYLYIIACMENDKDYLCNQCVSLKSIDRADLSGYIYLLLENCTLLLSILLHSTTETNMVATIDRTTRFKIDRLICHTRVENNMFMLR